MFVDGLIFVGGDDVVGARGEGGGVRGGVVGVRGVGVRFGGGVGGDLFQGFIGVCVDVVDDVDVCGDVDVLVEGVFFVFEFGVVFGKVGYYDGGVFVQRGRDDVEFLLVGKVVVVGLNV